MKKYSHTTEFYRKKIQSLLKSKYKYFITGLIVVIGVGIISVLQFRDKNILGIFTFDNSEESPISIADTEQIKEVINNKAIDYLTPSGSKNVPTQSSVLSQPGGTGQISAISSGQVTYTSKTYVVKPGDTLAIIALQVYGDVNAWTRIAEANNISNPDNVEVGSTLVIPR